MVLHTILCEYDVMQVQNAVLPPKTLTVSGGLVEYTETPEGRQVSRLFSTDPNLYLDKRYQPFSKLQ